MRADIMPALFTVVSLVTSCAIEWNMTPYVELNEWMMDG